MQTQITPRVIPYARFYQMIELLIGARPNIHLIDIHIAFKGRENHFALFNDVVDHLSRFLLIVLG